MSRTAGTVLRVMGAGTVSGMRTAMMLALLSRGLSGAARRKRGPVAFLASPLTGRLLVVAAAAELVVDKLPITPARTEAPPLVARACSGALAGAAIASIRRDATWPAAALGALSAVGSAYVMERVRRDAGRITGLPDAVIALAEDGVAIGLGRSVIPRA